MFPTRYFPRRYFYEDYWVKSGVVTSTGGGFFPGPYFTWTYFAKRYWTKKGSGSAIPPTPTTSTNPLMLMGII